MKVVGFAGFSGSGKTTLVEQLVAAFKLRGQRVSVVKHAHHDFDIDHPGKDSWRHRQAGAFEVVVASDRRLALMREFERPARLSVHHLIAELHDGVDWVLVEGFKNSDLLKIEVWRAAAQKPALYIHDEFIVAIATDAADAAAAIGTSPGTGGSAGAGLPAPTLRPLLDLNDPEAVAQWLDDNGNRFEYRPEMYS